MAAAWAAVNVLKAYSYSAKQAGREVVTDCPLLLAVPTIQRRVGFTETERLDLAAGRSRSWEHLKVRVEACLTTDRDGEPIT